MLVRQRLRLLVHVNLLQSGGRDDAGRGMGLSDRRLRHPSIRLVLDGGRS
ncbi:hypothetical protein M8C21_009063 [Ambrosia artemisiifolia]|uniref:Uncharacterized protein n=1 Tax=Ambrosia artemisiifolia TaxID=4212 RepID=A0AAD5D4Y4_AMBAR|nr:hypothetical protein M8C21_009063 [Ambrosia artemisiifolia]